MDVVLIAGLWLPAALWNEVAAALERLGHRAHPVALPGVDDASPSATLDDQLEAVLEVVEACAEPLVVGHSAAATLAWMTADRRPDATVGVVMVGGMPMTDGSPYAPFFPVVDGLMPFPGWEPFEGADSADLDVAARRRLAAVAVPVPAGVAEAPVTLRDERRFEVPVALVCPEFSPEQAREWLAAGEMPELERVRRLTFVDIESGHWPMVSCPDELARVLDRIAAEITNG